MNDNQLHNLRTKETKIRIYKKPWKEISGTELDSHILEDWKCATEFCKGRVTGPIVKFFNKDVTAVKCYECQDNNR